METQPTDATSSELPRLDDYKPNRVLQVGTYVIAGIAGLAMGANRVWDASYSKFKNSYGGKELHDQRLFIRDAVRRVVMNRELPSNLSSEACWDEVNAYVQKELPHREASFDIQRASSLDELMTDLRKIKLSVSPQQAAKGMEVTNKTDLRVTRTIEDWYNKNRRAIERVFGVETEGWAGKTIGVLQRFDDLSVPKRFAIGLSTAVSVGTVFGIYTLANQNQRLKTVNRQQDANMRELAYRIDAVDKRRNSQYDQGAAVR